MSTQNRVDVDITKVDYLKDWDGENPAPTHLIGRTSGGSRVHLVNDEVRPYFYVPLEDYGQSIENSDMTTKVEYGYESIYGEDMVKVYTRVPGDVPRLRNNTNHHEADILFPNRFLIDTGIEGAVSIPAEHATNEPSEIQLSDIEPTDNNIPSRVVFCDIEVDDSNGFPNEEIAEEEIVCLTTYDNYTEEYHLFFYHPELPIIESDRAIVHVFDNELSMMRSFVQYLMDIEPDVLAGWNFSDFDARYLLNRLGRLADEMELDDFDESSISTLGVAYDDGYFGGKIKGISVFDMLRAYKNLQFSELDSYRLEDVAQEELGTGKVKDSRSIYEQWTEEPEKLAEYNITDVELTVQLEEEQGIIKFYEEIANFVGGRLSEVIGVHKAVDIKVLRAVQGEWVVPSAKNVEGEKFEGAKVFDPITGVRENVIVLDLASLYPMSMKTLNAGPDTKVEEPGPNTITAPNGVSFTKEEDAIVVEMIDEMLEEREKYKKLRNKQKPDSKLYDIYDRKQAAVKVVMNCFSGDTEVLTPSGIRNIKDLEVGDDVYSINPDTNDIEIKKVTNTVQQHNEYGKLEHISTNNTDFKITPNHRMVVDTNGDTEIRHFDELPKGVNHTVPLHNSINGERIETKSILEESEGRLWINLSVHGNSFNSACPWSIKKHLKHSKNRNAYRLDDISMWPEVREHIGHMVDSVGVQYDDKHSTIPIEYDMDDWLELLGWVISEGSFNSVEEKHTEAVSYRGKSDRVQIAQKQSDHRTDIVSLVDRMGLNYSTDSNGVYLYNSNIYNILKSAVGDGSYNKKIPEWVFENDLPASQLKILLYALIDGDGDTTGHNSYRYTTSSEQLKEDVMKLATLCGFKVSSARDSSVWRVYINENKGSFNIGKNTETISHDGDVYCVQVEDNETLLAGRNGKFQWTGNTLYGVMGWDRFRLKDQDVGAAVTATGRAVIEHTKEVAEDMGYKVIYGDTDSVMLELGPDITKEDAKEIGFELEERINEAYDEFAYEELGVDEHWFDIEFEKLYRRYFQSGRKKRYAGHIVWKEGKDRDDIDIVGFEFKRSDYATIPKQIQEYVLDKIVRGGTFDEISEYVRDKVEKIRNGEYNLDEIGIPGGISKSFEDYDSPTMHVRGAMYAIEQYNANIQPGDKPKGLYVKRVLPGDDGQPEFPMPDMPTPFACWMNTERVPESIQWDWDEYVEVQIEGPLRRIFEGTDWTWEEIISGNIQPGLGDFTEHHEDAGDNSVVRVSPENEDDIVRDPNDLDHWERKRREAKKRLSNTQQFLEGFDPDEVSEDDSGETVSFKRTEKDKENLLAYLD